MNSFPRIKTLFVLSFALFLSLACVTSSGGNAPPAQPQNGDAVATIVAATLTAAAGGAPAQAPTVQPSGDIVGTMVAATLTAAAQNPSGAPPATAAPAVTAPPQSQTGMLPAGILVQPQDGVLAIYDTQGQSVATYNLSSADYVGWDQVAVGGPIANGYPPPPIFYTSYNNGGVIMVHNGQGDMQWVAAPDIIALAGAPAQPVVAYSLFITPTSGYDTRSALYYGTLSAPPTQPVLDQINADGYAIYPLAVEAENGQPKRIWYTTQLYGIGDVSYAPRRGLYTYDCDSGAETIVLQPTNAQGNISPVGISADFKWVAYTIADGSTLYWQPLDGSQPAQSAGTTSPANMGVGGASFSPNGTRIVWTSSNRDESGDMPVYTSYLQIHDPSTTYNEPQNSTLFPPGIEMHFATWLDNDTLLIASWASPSMTYKLSPVSSLLAGNAVNIQPFVSGEYLQLVYGQP